MGRENHESVKSDAPPANLSDEKNEIAESIVVTIPLALLVLESDLRVRIASQRFCDTFGVTQEETEGQLVYELGNGQWNIPLLKTLLEEILPDNQVFTDYEVTHTFEEIGHRVMLLNGGRLDNVQLILLNFVDITERKQSEEALLASHDRLEDALTQLRATQSQLVQQERLAAVGGLAAGVAHDFNNILSIIMLNVDLGLRTPKLPTRHYRQLETISTQLKRANNLIKQILDFSHRGELLPCPLEMVSVLNEQVEALRLGLPADIRTTVTHGSDSYVISADPTHVYQIFSNLALNAIDAMPGGGELRLSLQRLHIRHQDVAPCSEMGPGDWIQVSVSDTGTGIPPEVQPHIFEPFFTTKAPGKGTGLGLAQVHGLTQQNHGYVVVNTRPGKGTTFTVYLPAYDRMLP